MKTLTLFITILACGCLRPDARAQTPANSVVRFHFTAGGNVIGDVDVELFDTEKPITVRNFLCHVLNHRYTNTFIHRSVTGFIVQGGTAGANDPTSTNLFNATNDFTRVPSLPPIVNEYAVGPRRSNVYGTIAMAKRENDPNSATSEWFFNLGNNSANLDNQNGGFTVFGRVVADNASVLNMFSLLTYGRGIVDMRSFGGSSLFKDLPVTLTNHAHPKVSELFFVEITPLAIRELAAPKCSIVIPSTNIRVTNGLFTAWGTASDDISIREVRYELNGLGAMPAMSTNCGASWTASLLLQPGPNTLTVQSVDTSNNVSVVQQRSIFCVVLSELTVTNSGEGTILGATNHQRFEVGRTYRVTAQPARGQVFVGWSSGVNAVDELISTNLSTPFVMRQGLILRADFAPYPFSSVKGTYVGLYSESTGVQHESSGLAVLTVTERGTYTARMSGGGKVLGLSGHFAADGKATNDALRFGTNFFHVEWALDMSGLSDQLTATLKATNSWIAGLSADRVWFSATTNRATNYSGRHTLLIQGNDNAVASPGGDGYGTAVIGLNGYANLGSTLADGTPFTRSTPVSKNGRSPLYVPLYGGKGSIQGWWSFTNTMTDDFNGPMIWARPALPLAKFYPLGFVSTNSLSGARYAPPSNTTNRLLNFSDGFVSFNGGNLSASFTNMVLLSANNKVTNGNLNKLALTISTNNGLFTGTVTLPGRTNVLSYKGALHQKLNIGSGFFLNTNQSGQVFFGAR